MIRKATARDASGMAAVHIATWRDAYAGIVPRAYLDSLSVEKRTEMWVRQIDGGRSDVWVGLMDDGVTGFVAAGACRDDDLSECDEIYAIYVSPDSQRQGLGRSLMEVILSERSKACALWVLAGNENAIRFYRSLGFEADGKTKVVELGGERLLEARYRRLGEPDATV